MIIATVIDDLSNPLFMTNAKPSFIAANERVDGYTHVLLITTGSVASIKTPIIVSELLDVRRPPVDFAPINAFLSSTRT